MLISAAGWAELVVEEDVALPSIGEAEFEELVDTEVDGPENRFSKEDNN